MQTIEIKDLAARFDDIIHQVETTGVAVSITRAGLPIARLQPYHPEASDSPSGAPTPALAALYEAGVLTPPARPSFDVASFLGSLPQTPPLSPEKSLTTAVLADREESP